MLAMCINAGVPVPTDTPAFVFKSKAGTMEAESSRKITLYFKCSVPDSKIYIQWGDSTEAQEVTIAKANSLSSLIQLQKIKVPDMEVKVWGKNINFLNCGGSKIYEFKINTDGKQIQELRLGDNPLPDMKFLNDIDSLNYLVIGTNNFYTTLDLNNQKLARLDLASSSTLTTLKFDCPRIYEFKLISATSVKKIDLSKSVDLKTVNMSMLTGLESFDFGKGEKLEKVLISNSPLFKSLAFENYPVLNDLTVMNMENLESLKLNNLPKLSKLALKTLGAKDENATSSLFPDLTIENFLALTQLELYQLYTLKNLKMGNLPLLNKFTMTYCPLKEIEIPELPSLATLIYSNNPNTEKITFACTSLTSIDMTNLVKLKEIDLSAQKGLTKVSIINGGLEKLKFDPESWKAKMNILSVKNNHLSFPNIPYKAKSYTTAGTNYYAPQAQLPEVPKDIDTEYIFDYSNWQTGNNGEVEANTEYKCITKFEEELKQGVDFKVTEGKIQFLKEIEDSVFIQLDNAAFPMFKRTVDPKTGKVTDYRVMTNLFKVNASQSGIEDVADDEAEGVKVRGRVFMAAGKKMVTVFDAQGRKVGSGYAVEVKSPGLYIAKCGKKAVKAVIK